MVGVFLLALALRLAYLFQISDIGFWGQPVSDAFIYMERARGIAAGDWLGPADFVHAPSYAYLLGIIRIFGGEYWAPRVTQCVFGALSCVLVAALGRRCFGVGVGILAGVLLALYPPAIFFDGLIQKTSLALLLSAALLVTLTPRQDWSLGPWRAAAAGVLLGLLALTRQNALALAPLILAWVWWSSIGAARSARVARVCACGLGLVLTLLPWAVRNKVVLGDFVLTTPNLGQNFAMGNSGMSSGTYYEFKRGTGRAEVEQDAWVRAVERAIGHAPSAREVSDYYLDQSLGWMKANPGAWLKLMVKKWFMVWNAYEAFDTEDYYVYRERASIIRELDPVLHFGVLAPLAATGVVLTFSQWRRLWLLYGWLVFTALAVAVFVVFARYRFPLMPVLVVFAAAGLAEGFLFLRQRRFRPLVGGVAALVAAAVACNWPIDHRREPDAVSYTNLAVVLRDAHRFEESLAASRSALGMSPEHVGANLVMCNTLAEIGRFTEAGPYCEYVVAAAPDYSAGYRGMGDVLMGLGRLNEAVERYSKALEVDPDDYRALCMMATAFARMGRASQAIELFETVIQAAPNYPEAHINLGNTYLVAQRLEEAIAAYERAIELRPGSVEALYMLGVAEQAKGEPGKAESRFRRALEVDPNFEPAKTSLRELQAATK
jgi:tetratricopeptide (TPR) repeat protein